MAVIISDMQRELDVLNEHTARVMRVVGRHVDSVTISMVDLLELIDYAEDSIIEADMEHSSPPSEEERVFMMRMWRLAGKKMPGWFGRHYGWVQE